MMYQLRQTFIVDSKPDSLSYVNRFFSRTLVIRSKLVSFLDHAVVTISSAVISRGDHVFGWFLNDLYANPTIDTVGSDNGVIGT